MLHEKIETFARFTSSWAADKLDRGEKWEKIYLIPFAVFWMIPLMLITIFLEEYEAIIRSPLKHFEVHCIKKSLRNYRHRLSEGITPEDSYKQCMFGLVTYWVFLMEEVNIRKGPVTVSISNGRVTKGFPGEEYFYDLLASLRDLSLLDSTYRDLLMDECEELSKHLWGYVRRPAIAIYEELKKLEELEDD